MTCCDCRRGADDVFALLPGANELLDFVGMCEATCCMVGSDVLAGVAWGLRRDGPGRWWPPKRRALPPLVRGSGPQ